MSTQECEAVINAGVKFATELLLAGFNCLLIGEMGIGNTTSSAAMASVLCNLPIRKAVGLGTNISSKRWNIKCHLVEKAIAKNGPFSDAFSVLQKLGGFEFAYLTGLIIGASKNHLPVILDGFNTAISALLAKLIYPNCQLTVLPSHLSGEPAHLSVLKELKLSPYFDLQIKLSETAGSGLLLQLWNHLNTPKNPTNLLPKKSILSNFPSLNTTYRQMATERWNNLTKPCHSLGQLENIVIFLADFCQTPYPSMEDLRNRQKDLSAFFYQISTAFFPPPRERELAQGIGYLTAETALALFHGMKTFSEADVSIANNGIGKYLQKKERKY